MHDHGWWLAVGALALLPAQAAAQKPEADPFAESQIEQVLAPPAAAGIPGLTVSGFVDAGYIKITQSGATSEGNLSWAYGNSQFGFSNTADTYTLNEVDLTLRSEQERGALVIGALASVDFYPSRDDEIYQGGASDRSWQVDQAFVYAAFTQSWNTRVRLGRTPGVMTLEQLTENESPDSRLIGHTYVYQAGGGYPYGVQVKTEPFAGLTVHVGQANGGMGDYTFNPTDRTTTNRPVAADKDQKDVPADKLDSKTLYSVVDWVAFDQPAGVGRFQLGASYANNPGLTYNLAEAKKEPYSFSDVWAAYKISDYEARLEVANLDTFYAGENSLGSFQAGMYSLLLSYELSAAHLFTLRYEWIAYRTDIDPNQTGEAIKYGITYRWRIADPMVLKAEYVTETQAPQFLTMDKDLTTNVAALSWVYSF